MKMLFEYNWQVRDEWFSWCDTVPEDELSKLRMGGMGSFLKTLFHIVDVEQAWILQGLHGEPEFHYQYEDYQSVKAIRDLSRKCRPSIKQFVENWAEDFEGVNMSLHIQIRRMTENDVDFVYQGLLGHDVGKTRLRSRWVRGYVRQSACGSWGSCSYG